MTVGSLFAGIGGFELAAELRGCWDRDDLPTPTPARVDDGDTQPRGQN